MIVLFQVFLSDLEKAMVYSLSHEVMHWLLSDTSCSEKKMADIMDKKIMYMNTVCINLSIGKRIAV